MVEYVIDASVAIKWYFDDEKYARAAERLLLKFGMGEIGLVAPALLGYEVMNAFRTAVLRERATKEQSLEFAREFVSLSIPMLETSFLSAEILQIAIIHQLSAYDASYLAKSEFREFPLVTADRKMYDLVKGISNQVMWIEEVV